MRISRKPTPVGIMIDQKQPENVEYLIYLRNIITNDATCTCEIKSRIAMAKVAFNRKMTLFTTKEGTSDILNLEHSFVWC